MTLHPDWKAILTRAWSVRFAALAGLAAFVDGSVQAYLSGMTASVAIDFAIGALSAATAISRIIAQEGME